MWKKAAAVLLIAAILVGQQMNIAFADDTSAPSSTSDTVIKTFDSGDNVLLLQMRLRDLGYYNYKVTGYFAGFTQKALQDFQKNNGITADGVAGQDTLNALYSNDAKKKSVEPRVKPTPKPVVKTKGAKYGKYLDWWTTVKNMWKFGMKCKVVDLDTGISYTMVRVGGNNHADVAPATAADTAKLKKTFGNAWSWTRRAVVVWIGSTPVAGSTNGMPHGNTGVKGNGMNLPNGTLQQVCIHFLNSRTHIHNAVDPAHQYEVKRAAGMSVSGQRPPALADN